MNCKRSFMIEDILKGTPDNSKRTLPGRPRDTELIKRDMMVSDLPALVPHPPWLHSMWIWKHLADLTSLPNAPPCSPVDDGFIFTSDALDGITTNVRRTRTVFTDIQLLRLESHFKAKKYLSTTDRSQLAQQLGLTQLQVKTWYQNRRMKWKREEKKTGRQVELKNRGQSSKAENATSDEHCASDAGRDTSDLSGVKC